MDSFRPAGCKTTRNPTWLSNFVHMNSSLEPRLAHKAREWKALWRIELLRVVNTNFSIFPSFHFLFIVFKREVFIWDVRFPKTPSVTISADHTSSYSCTAVNTTTCTFYYIFFFASPPLVSLIDQASSRGGVAPWTETVGWKQAILLFFSLTSLLFLLRSHHAYLPLGMEQKAAFCV